MQASKFTGAEPRRVNIFRASASLNTFDTAEFGLAGCIVTAVAHHTTFLQNGLNLVPVIDLISFEFGHDALARLGGSIQRLKIDSANCGAATQYQNKKRNEGVF